MKKNSYLIAVIGLFAVFSISLAACKRDTPTDSTVEAVQTQAPGEIVGGEDVELTDEPSQVETQEPIELPEPEHPAEEYGVVPVTTSATNVVGVGSYVAAEPYARIVGEEEEASVRAFIMPYGIYPDMHVYNIEAFNYEEQNYKRESEGFRYQWALEVPEGSNARLLKDHLALFLTDIPGEYVLSLVAFDESGNSAEISWTVWAGTYVTNKGLDAEPEGPECAACHQYEVAAWSKTSHATKLENGLNGNEGNTYGEVCIWCHTTGFNDRPEAVNGGFDDLMVGYGWSFPEELGPGVFNEFVRSYPEVAALGNIQCETCHGPGSDHEGEGPIGNSLEYGVCTQCHALNPAYNAPIQWELSAHAQTDSRSFWLPIEEGREECAQCHSGKGFIDFVSGFTPEVGGYEFQVISCAVCHDPHDVFSPNQLRVFGSVTLPDGSLLEGYGVASTCMVCHNQHYDSNDVILDSIEEGLYTGENFVPPHYSAATELLIGTGGYTWGEILPASPHIFALDGLCVRCHMVSTPGMDDMGTPNDFSDDVPLPGHDTVGEHTFAMVSSVDETENIGACLSCHEDMVTFDLDAKGDYDGDGVVETNALEIDGLIAILQHELDLKGVEFLENYPYYEIPVGVDKDVLGGVWNYHLLVNNNVPAHNLKYLVSLAQLTYEKLSGYPLPNAFIVK